MTGKDFLSYGGFSWDVIRASLKSWTWYNTQLLGKLAGLFPDWLAVHGGFCVSLVEIGCKEAATRL